MSETTDKGGAPLDPKTQQMLINLLTASLKENKGINFKGFADLESAEATINQLIQAETEKLNALIQKNSEILQETEKTEKFYEEKMELYNEGFKKMVQEKEMLRETKEQKMGEYETSIRELENRNKQLDTEIENLRTEITKMREENKSARLQGVWLPKANNTITDVSDFLRRVPDKAEALQEAVRLNEDLVRFGSQQVKSQISYPLISKHVDYRNLVKIQPKQQSQYQQPIQSTQTIPQQQYSYSQTRAYTEQVQQQQAIMSMMSQQPMQSIQQLQQIQIPQQFMPRQKSQPIVPQQPPMPRQSSQPSATIMPSQVQAQIQKRKDIQIPQKPKTIPKHNQINFNIPSQSIQAQYHDQNPQNIYLQQQNYQALQQMSQMLMQPPPSINTPLNLPIQSSSSITASPINTSIISQPIKPPMQSYQPIQLPTSHVAAPQPVMVNQPEVQKVTIQPAIIKKSVNLQPFHPLQSQTTNPISTPQSQKSSDKSILNSIITPAVSTTPSAFSVLTNIPSASTPSVPPAPTIQVIQSTSPIKVYTTQPPAVVVQINNEAPAIVKSTELQKVLVHKNASN
ncbi:hypothetical protein TVAG_263100 [Trichomonas vaginalis G3]|uniref:Uncharacterized protein n=1 Tax=Trichomonas vaginalis (strain ATCC PRA-98 / G3) TaxID=412133 RepID=A2FA57_TRIV3|nr:hypothetical protein TVAGG3_0386920 [Trichomonas vaginalis G3]EAX98193.1 hypothetical protein TVAG_263100 [Trichomonas vaginalis G3]KAI5533707.1 hypothetical protein TVAGG3_0386920 [Trichomonas vaginalis G3]|eukprot:XP_001311123.1 hypothetical protein [Trichomonas vaginalis G3]